MNPWAIILCGGGSRRMGRDKATLEFAGQPMLTGVVQRLSATIPPARMLCVAAQGQTLPELPAEVNIVFDRTSDCGPLEGLATGLSTTSAADAVFVTTCDAPLVAPELPTFLASMLGEQDAVVPRLDGQLYPLTAVYRPSVAKLADERLARGERRVIDWVAELNARYVSREELAEVDPELWSLRNCNTPEEYAALVEAGGKIGER
ncbi:molybdenum cofactor guanylyltransferase [Aeoliella sp. ICT_H6.2]|uniref:Probable molybdenum cofactor guanylyltransferase n=1 Tax=Aeoliella straminimaris TaxID=2954799 RepID=A0A9X2FCZ2_9BACT|nr:molybdenum cofactor guanylyltransferase [Aeoliella straminimaris]MCO6046685.1 molybdenum cofactor guanylyltransferase [Aeoliella straminimaris]